MKAKTYDEDDVARYIHFAAEQFKEEFKTFLETFDYIREQVSHIPAMRADIDELKTDMKVLKALYKTHAYEIKQLQTVAHSH